MLEVTPTLAGLGGRTRGYHPRMPLHPSRMQEHPLLLQNSSTLPSGSIFGERQAGSPPRRLPPAAPFAAPPLPGIIFAPQLIKGVVTRQISSPDFLLPSLRAGGGGMPVSIAMRLALISISFLGELITKGVTKEVSKLDFFIYIYFFFFFFSPLYRIILTASLRRRLRSGGNYLLLLTDVGLKNLTGRISIEIACGLILVRMGSASTGWWGRLSRDLSHLTCPLIWWVSADIWRAICPIPALCNSPKLLFLEQSLLLAPHPICYLGGQAPLISPSSSSCLLFLCAPQT